MKRLFPLMLCLLLLAGCTGDGDSASGVSDQFFAMDTLMTITVHDGDEGAVPAARSLLFSLDAALSRTRATSEISALNESAGTGVPVSLSPPTFTLLERAVALAERTGGAFDPTIAPMMDAWGFTREEKHVPDADTLTALLPLVGWHALALDKEAMTASLPTAGMAIDLGAIAKGAAAAGAADVLRDHGVTSGLLMLGGNITALGHKPDGTPWRVAVRDPADRDSYLCVLSLTDQSASTSGGYERYFEEHGVLYHHIIDPSTGYPAECGLLSVTVVSADDTAADALSTALFVLGEEGALSLWRASDDFEAILIRTDGRVLVTEGLEAVMEFRGDDHGYQYEIVRR